MQVRPAAEMDLAALLPLVRSMHEHESIPTEAWTETALRELITNADEGFVLVAENPDLIGYVVVGYGFSLEFAGRDAFVDELYVTSNQRGKGIGRALLKAAELGCGRAGVKALHLEVDHANADAKRLYSQRGYGEHSRHLMTKWLSRP